MSRIGKKAITLPSAVKLVVDEAGHVSVTGPKGTLAWQLPKCISVSVDGANVVLTRASEDRDDRAKHGLSRALLANMVTGVSAGFVKDLEIHGVGFKAAVKASHQDL